MTPLPSSFVSVRQPASSVVPEPKRALGFEVLIGLIELELGTLYELAVLVELYDVGLGHRHEVELELHVGVEGAALRCRRT